MNRKFFTNISLLIVLNIIVKAFWVLGIDRTVQNVVGAEEYGLYFSLFSFSVLFNILLDFGVTNYNNRRIATSPSDLPEMLANIFIIRFAFALIYLIVTLLVAKGVGYNSRQTGILSVLMVNQFIISFILYLRSNITALHLFRIDSIISVTDRFIMIVVCAILLWSGITDMQFKIEWFVYCQTFAYGLTFLATLGIVIYKGKIKAMNFTFSKMRIILRESSPFALLALFMTIYWRVDSVMIERLLPDGPKEVGIYAQAFRLLDAAAMIPFLFSIILLPMFSDSISKSEPISSILHFSTFLLLLPVTSASIISVLYAEEIMGLLYHDYVAESAEVISTLMIGYIPVSLIYIYSTYFTATGKMLRINTIALSAMILNIIFNLLLIPILGIRGAAITSVGTQSVMLGIYIYVVLSRGRIEGSLRHLLRVGLYILLMFIIALFVKIFAISLIPGIIIISFSGAALLLLFGVINLRHFLPFHK